MPSLNSKGSSGWSLADIITYERKRQAGTVAVCAPKPEPNQGQPLEGTVPGETTGGQGAKTRYRVRFIIYAFQPCDWDNYFIKPLQDLLVAAGLLPGDDWETLEGSIQTRKARSKDERRTEILIERCED